MNAPSSPQLKRPVNLLTLGDEFITLILPCREGRDLGEIDAVRTQLTDCLQRLESHALDAGLGRDEVAALRYPLVALADELILNSEWDHRGAWRDQPLQLALFNDRMAGNRFFDQLELLRQSPEANRSLLLVFLTCLTLGFQGKYRITGQDHLQQLKADLAKQLNVSLSQADKILSPHGKQRDGFIPEVRGRSMFWLFTGLGAGLVVLLAIVFYFWIGHSASQALELMPKAGA